MRCPKCGGQNDKVIDSRAVREAGSIRRRRECQDCLHRFTTYERVETTPLEVVKRDGRREPFSPEKLVASLRLACQKRPVSAATVEAAAARIADSIYKDYDNEAPTEEIGRRVMRELREIDAVAYVRFASIYRRFAEVGQFVEEINRIATRPPPDRRQLELGFVESTGTGAEAPLA